MASAWGYSWGLAFGKAWGVVTSIFVGEPHTRRLRIPKANRRLHVKDPGRTRRILERNKTYEVSVAAARRVAIHASSRIRSVVQASRKVFK